MPPNRFESEVESFLEGSHGDRTHIKRADHPRLHHYAGRYSGALHTASGGGFARHEVVAQRVAGVLDPHVVQFPQSGGGEVSTRGGVTPKVQITSEKSAEYGLLWAKWSAIWTQRCLA